MTGSTSAELVADLEARTAQPLTYLVLATAGAAVAGPPAFLPRGLALGLDVDLAIVGRQRFGGALEPPESDGAPDLAALTALVLPAGAERVLSIRNRFLLPRLARTVPFLLDGCRGLLVQVPSVEDDQLNGHALAALLAPHGLMPAAISRPTANGTVHRLFERGGSAASEATPSTPAVLASEVRFENGYVTGEVRLDRPAEAGWALCLFAGEAPVGIAAATPGDTPDRLRFRVWAAPELLAAEGATLRVALARLADQVAVRHWPRPAARRFVPDALLSGGEPAASLKRPYGVLLLGHPADPRLAAVLESLAGQDAQAFTHLRLDGPAGGASERLADHAAGLGFGDVLCHRGAIGPDKIAVQGLWHMTRLFDQVIVLDGGSLPLPGALAALLAALDRTDRAVVSGWSGASGPATGGWAARADHLAPLVQQLAFLFSLEEEDYRCWSREDGGPGTDRFGWADALWRLLARDGPGIATTERALFRAVQASPTGRTVA